MGAANPRLPMLKSAVLLASILATSPALAAETPWSIQSDVEFQQRAKVQVIALGGVAAGIGVMAAASLAPSGSGASSGIERTGLVLAGAGVLVAGLNLPTLSAYGWRQKRYAWSHPLAVVGAAPMMLMGGCAVGWGLSGRDNDGLELGFVLGIVVGLFGSLVTHVPGTLGPFLMAVERPPPQLGLQLLPPMSPWESSTVAAGKRVPAATLTARW